jgi:hypothetical protein
MRIEYVLAKAAPMTLDHLARISVKHLTRGVHGLDIQSEIRRGAATHILGVY